MSTDGPPSDSGEERVRTYDRDGVPHDDVLRTKSGKVITEEDINRWAEEAAEGWTDPEADDTQGDDR